MIKALLDVSLIGAVFIITKVMTITIVTTIIIETVIITPVITMITIIIGIIILAIIIIGIKIGQRQILAVGIPKISNALDFYPTNRRSLTEEKSLTIRQDTRTGRIIRGIRRFRVATIAIASDTSTVIALDGNEIRRKTIETTACRKTPKLSLCRVPRERRILERARINRIQAYRVAHPRRNNKFKPVESGPHHKN